MAGKHRTELSQWLPGAPPPGQCQCPLFCFSHAGSSAEHYRTWQNVLQPNAEVIPVELPGRGIRFGEPFVTDMTSAAKEIISAISAYNRQPFAFFGHSLGALLALEVTALLHTEQCPLPFLLIIAGLAPPYLGRNRIPDHRASDCDLMAEIRLLGGTPDDALQSTEFKDFFLPIFRNDFKLAKSSSVMPQTPLNVPLAALGGEDDPETTADALSCWRQMSTVSCEVRLFPGGHFFIHEHKDNVLHTVAALIHRYRPSQI